MKQALYINHPGFLSQLQDLGRIGQSHLGLTTSGPADKFAFIVANRLLNNPDNAAQIELSHGGASFTALIDCTISITGAKCEVFINQRPQQLWRSMQLQQGDTLEIGYSQQGLRCYLAISGGFLAKEYFGSVATTIREQIGGSDGQPLAAKHILTCHSASTCANQMLDMTQQPEYSQELVLRLIPGYQHALFPSSETQRFFHHEFRVDQQSDRMGYRLTGSNIDSGLSQLYSEGISFGAVQIPPDGQPIVLMNDRQTIGGYPKIGTVLSLDCHKLSQVAAGHTVRFEAISIEQAQNALHVYQYQLAHLKLKPC